MSTKQPTLTEEFLATPEGDSMLWPGRASSLSGALRLSLRRKGIDVSFLVTQVDGGLSRIEKLSDHTGSVS